MKTRPLAVALLVALTPAVALPPRVSFAQAADDTTTKMARQRFQEGVGYYDKGQYEMARAAFLQAYALRKHPAVLLNLAQSSLKSGHASEAAKYFQQFLREHTSATSAQRADAERGLIEARSKLAHVDVIGAPSGAEIFVDDERVGTVPLERPIDVEPGTRTIRARGRTEESVQITASAGQSVTARFSAPSAVAPIPPPPAPPVAPVQSPPPPVETPPPAVEPTPSTEPTSATTAPESAPSHGGFFSAPDNLAPVFIGGILALGGFGTAIGVGVIAKGKAQDSADAVAAAIAAQRKIDGAPVAGACNPAPARYVHACSALDDDDSKVNTDALIGNIALGVGIGATVLTVIYWAAAARTPSQTADSRPVLAPMIGKGVGGLTLGGTF